MTTEATTDTTSTNGGSGADGRMGLLPSQADWDAAMAAFDGVEGSGGEAGGASGEAKGEGGEPEGEGKARRVVKDAKELEAEEAARKAKEIEDATPGAFKARRRQLRELETKEANVAARIRQLEGMQAELKGQLDKSDKFDALEAELKASPAKVLRRYGIDLSALNVEYMKGADPASEVKTVAQEIADLRKQWAEEKAAAQKTAEQREYEAVMVGAIDQVVGLVPDAADEFPAAAFFAGVEPIRFKALVRQAIDHLAKQGGKVYAEQVVKILDEHYKESYAAIKPRLTAGTSRPSTGPTTAAKLEKAPQSLGRATSTPVGSKDPESYDERFKAALNELLTTHQRRAHADIADTRARPEPSKCPSVRRIHRRQPQRTA